ncbi:MAG: RluA family pseudouridine synthase [Pseudomonadota bacterium]
MSGQVITETVSDKEAGVRLDRWVKRRTKITQGQIEKLLRTGQIRVDGARAKANTRLEAGMSVRLPPMAPEMASSKPKQTIKESDRAYMRDLVIYEDDEMIALNKPSGIAVQGGTKTTRHIDGMLGGLSDGEHRPKLVHRLDRDTSGVLLVAKHPAAAARLGNLFRSREMAKVYWAVTVGVPHPSAGQLRGWMAKGIGSEEEAERGQRPDREKMYAAQQNDEGARHAVTDYVVVSTAARRAAWVALRPQTGRTHQLRFHMAEIGSGILGDPKYKTGREVPQGVGAGLHLHARALIVPKKSGRPVEIVAPISGHMRETFDTLGFLEREAGDDPQELFA